MIEDEKLIISGDVETPFIPLQFEVKSYKTIRIKD